MSDATTRPRAKGWCPGAHRPMMAGDGLVLRVRPRHSRLDKDQMHALCELAQRFGQGELQLTNRANLQLRGIAGKDHATVLSELEMLGLLDRDAETEERRNVIVAADSQPGDRNERVSARLIGALNTLPDLPAKFGFAIDCGPVRRLTEAPADIRVEAGKEALVVRADGAASGIACDEAGVLDAVHGLAVWFSEASGDARRMASVVAETPLPPELTGTRPTFPCEPIVPDDTTFGVAFGVLPAASLAAVLSQGGIDALRFTPDRLIRVEGTPGPLPDWAITDPRDPLLSTQACVGAERCPAASVSTRSLARHLAGRVAAPLHVSGCTKGCARPRPAATTLVGNAGRFDLVKDGAPWDAPQRSGLTPSEAQDPERLI